MRKFIGLLVLGTLVLVVACGRKTQSTPKPHEMAFYADTLLPEKAGTFTLKSKVAKRTPEQLREFVGELGAATLESYNLVGLVAALYGREPGGLSIEIAQFDNHVDAYGYYALTRPDGVDTVSLGLEGYVSGSSFYFTQADYAVTVSVLGGSKEVLSTVLPVAVTISAKISSNPPLPEQFSYFPDTGLIVPSFKYYARDYLDIPPLTQVFTADYAIGRGNPFTLFLSEDPSGTKFLEMTQRTGYNVENAPPPPGFAFDEGYAILFHDEQRGTIVSGLRGGWLLGIVGYDPELHRAFFSEWVNNWNRRRAYQP
jgi:hypothetical protein